MKIINKLNIYSFILSVFFFSVFIAGYPFDNLDLNFVIFLISVFFILLFSKKLLVRYYFIIFIFIVLNLISFIYFNYIYFNFFDLTLKGPFDFSVFSFENIERLLNNMMFIFGTIFLSISFVQIYSEKKLKRQFLNKIKYYLILIKRIKSIYLYMGLFILFFVGIIIFAYDFNIFKASYGSWKQGLIFPKGLRALLSIILVFIYFLLSLKNNLDYLKFLLKMIVLIGIFLISLSQGSRGSAVGILTIILIIDFFIYKRKSFKLLNLILNLYILFILIFLWPIMRGHIYESGLIGAYIYAYDKIKLVFYNFNEIQFFVLPMIPMTLFHFLYVIDLINNHISLNFSTFINLIPQQIPEFLANLIGFNRPISDPWKLAQYFFHGGGFYIFAQAYWNGGLLPLFLFTFIIMRVLFFIENLFKKLSLKYYIVYPIFLYLIPVNIFYGIQPFVRGLEYGFIAMFLVYLFSKKGKK